MVVQQVAQIIVCITAPQIDFIPDKNNRDLIINLRYPGHPVALQPLNTIQVSHIIHQYDNISFFNLRISILLIIFTR